MSDDSQKQQPFKKKTPEELNQMSGHEREVHFANLISQSPTPEKKVKKPTPEEKLIEKAKILWLIANICKYYQRSDQHSLEESSQPVKREKPLTNSDILHCISKQWMVGKVLVGFAQNFLENGTIGIRDATSITKFTKALRRMLPNDKELRELADLYYIKQARLKKIEELTAEKYPDALEGYDTFKQKLAVGKELQFDKTTQISLGTLFDMLDEKHPPGSQLDQLKREIIEASNQGREQNKG